MRTKLIIFLSVCMIGGIYVAWQQYRSWQAIDTYQYCIGAKGSIIQESYPATCITKLGTRFTEPVRPQPQCDKCPLLTPTASGFCNNGTIRQGIRDECGCQTPPECIPEQSNEYSCPSSAWVDCMPGPDKPNPQCSPTYLNWARANCPEFQGAAL